MAVHAGGRSGLFDREAELAAIEATVARALAAEGGLLVVRGPAGIGKSALLRAAERSAEQRGMIVMRARAAPFERGFPYGVVRQLFEPVLAQGDVPAEELLAGAAAGARTVLDDEPRLTAAPDSVFVGLHALYWLTANLTGHRPVLICVDDVIWCDDASLRYFGFLVRRLEGMSVALALTYRTGEPQRSALVDALVLDPVADVLHPGPLSEPALSEMLADGLREEVAPEFCNACWQATGGNPLLVTELLRALEVEHVRPLPSEVARVRRIGSVAIAPAVTRRLEFLGEHAQAVAQAVAILGEAARWDDLKRISDLGAIEVEEALDALAGAGIVHSKQRMSFVHPLVADAVRAGLTPRKSARLHEQAVHALSERGASSWEVAPHVVAGAVRAHPSAIGLLTEAAHWALGAGAPEAAVTYLTRALAEMYAADDPAPLLLELGWAKVQAGDPSARSDLARAIELGRDVQTRAKARIALSVVLFAAGQDVRAIEVLDEGMDEIARENPELAERMEGHLLSHIEVAGPSQVKVPRIVAKRVTRARSARKPRDTVAARLVLCALAYEEIIGGGSATEAFRLAQRALANDELLHAEGPTCMPMYRAIVTLIVCDELELAAAHLTRAIAEARRLASPTAFMWASAWRAAVNLRRGRLMEAEADADAARESGDQYLSGYGPTLAGMWLAGSLTEQGRLDEARGVLRQVPEPDPPNVLTYGLIDVRARLHLACGEYEAAAREFDLYRTLDEPTAGLVEWRRPASGILGLRMHGARALIGLDDLDNARALVEQELPLAKALGSPRAIGTALHVAALLERGEARIHALKRATEELARSQSRLEFAAALCDYGAALRRANRRSEARPPLWDALTIAREARAAPLRDRAAQELKASGARVSRPGVTGVDALTASEHRIASMAAAGMSNRDIAQGLFVTVKTVEMHLGHVYQKLNLTGRAQLSGVLGNRGTAEHALAAPRGGRAASLK